MPDFIILEDGNPKHIRGLAHANLLWDSERLFPILDMARFDGLSIWDRQKIAAFEGTVPKRPDLLIKEVKRTICQRDIGANKDLAFRAAWKKRFYEISQVAKSRAVRRCALRTPSKLPFVYKLATGLYEFDSHEVREISRKAELLIEAGRMALFSVMRRAGLTRYAYKGIEDGQGKDPAIDAIGLAVKWYGLKSRASLDHLAGFWGGEGQLFSYIARRAKWCNTSVKGEIERLSQLELPETQDYNPHEWRRLLERQMRQPWKQAKDYILLYPRMDKVSSFLRKSNILLYTCERDYLFSIAFKQFYARANEYPELAQLCMDQRYPERIFDDALQTMRRVSARDLIPDIHIDGAHFGLPGYELVKLAKNDPLILVAGAMTNCCGHIGGGRKKRPLVRAMVTHEDVGCYAVRRKGERNPSAKMTVWLSLPDAKGHYDLVLNAWHDSDEAVGRVMEGIFVNVGLAAKDKDPNIQGVYLGNQLGKDRKIDLPIIENGGIRPRDKGVETKDTSSLLFVIMPPPRAAVFG